MKRVTSIFTILGIACLTVMVGWVFRTAQSPSPSSSGEMSGSRPIPIWHSLPEQSFAQNPNGKFGVKAILVTPQEILFFTEMQSSLTGTPRVEVALSNMLSEENSSNTLSAEKLDPNFLNIGGVESLGKMGEIEIGVIRLARINQPDQRISLRASLPKSNNQGWQITPLKQLEYDTHPDRKTFFPIESELSGTRIELGRLGGESDYAVLKWVESKNTSSPPTFLRVDRTAMVSQITAAEFKTLTSSNLSTETQSEIEESSMATPAPLENP